MTTLPYAKPLPVTEPLTAPYWDHAANHRLAVQQCRHCGDRHFPPCEVCPVCLSGEQEWQVVSGRATLVSWVRFHRPYWDGYRGQLPYDVCLVQLEEGPLIISNFAGDAPSDAHMGMPLEAVFDDVTERISLVRFAPKP
jgi:uncharacterized OB-fold protein